MRKCSVKHGKSYVDKLDARKPLGPVFKTNDVVSKRFVKISNINISKVLLFFIEKM